MAGEITVAYSPRSKGWTSFFSYHPDWMLGLNSTFYTWKDGNLYEHDRNSLRNNFYVDFSSNENPKPYFSYPSTITTIFNQDPTTNKMFKTLALESTAVWKAELTSDLNTGIVDVNQYSDKEGTYFGYVHNLSSSVIDPNSISTQGIGRTNAVNPLVPSIAFPFAIPSNVSIGDKVYKVDVNNVTTYLGNISAISSNLLEYLPDPFGTPPLVGDMIFIVKNNVAESYGVRGYYMEVELTNTFESEVELFEVSSSAFKSYP
jgi:hypothetical protein